MMMTENTVLLEKNNNETVRQIEYLIKKHSEKDAFLCTKNANLCTFSVKK